MHSKTHFKFPFKSSKISNVSIKTIFFLNTILPKEHYQIYFTIFEATKLKIENSQKNSKTGSNELSHTLLSLTGGTRWSGDPTSQ